MISTCSLAHPTEQDRYTHRKTFKHALDLHRLARVKFLLQLRRSLLDNVEDPGGTELDRGGREQRRNRVSVYAMALRVHDGNQGFGID